MDVACIAAYSDAVAYEAHATFAMVATVLAISIWNCCCLKVTVIRGAMQDLN